MRHYKEALKSIQQIPRFAVQTDTTQAGMSQTGTSQAGTSQAGTSQAGMVRPSHAGMAQTITTQAAMPQTGTTQAAMPQTGTTQRDIVQTGTGLMEGSTQQHLCERLQLLIASREAGNDSPEILMEARRLLKMLLDRNVISATERKLIHHHFLR